MRIVPLVLLLLAPACKDAPPDDSEAPLPDEDGDGFDTSEDCNDEDPAINPDADEFCDGIDHNCDGVADLGAIDAFTYYLDSDNDGFGDPNTPQRSCTQPDHFVAINTDCDDHNNLVYPGAQEICDDEDTDEDCDGQADDDDSSVDTATMGFFYADADGDGYGEGEGTLSCDAGAGFAPALGDCDESNADVNPGATEICGNRLDDDCDGSANGCSPAGSLSLGDYTSIVGAAGDLLGSSLAGGVDLSGDGVDDWVVGATQVSSGAQGYVKVLGTNTASPHATLTGASRGSEAGAALSVARAGSTSYLAIGAPGQSNDDGAVYHLSGSITSATLSSPFASGTNSEEMGAAVVLGSSAGQLVGCVFSAGTGLLDCGGTPLDLESSQVALAAFDPNGDGSSDLAAGLPSSSSGVVMVQGDGFNTQFIGDNEGDEFGGAVAYGADVNGDGRDDLFVGAPARANTGGGAYLYTTVPASGYVFSRNATATIAAGNSGDRVGRSVTLVDLDADGNVDLVVGAPGRDDANSDQGAAFLFYGPVSGSLQLADADAVFWGESTFAAAGSTLARAGDVNNDGYDDLAIGAPGESTGGSLAGAAYLILGGSL